MSYFFGPRGAADPMFDSGIDDLDTSAMPSFSNPLRSSAPDGGSLGINLAAQQTEMLSETARASGAPRTSRMLATGARKLPIVGSFLTGMQTFNNNTANLSTTGRVAHGGLTALASAVTPTPVALADAATGNYGANAIEDATGAMLSPFFGKESDQL